MCPAVQSKCPEEPTFLGQAPPLAVAGLPVQQFALGAARGRRGSPQAVAGVAEGVSPTRVPGRGLPQPSPGLGPQPGLLEAGGGGGGGGAQPVTVDLLQVLVAVLIFGPKGVAQVRRLCWTRSQFTECKQDGFQPGWATRAKRNPPEKSNG